MTQSEIGVTNEGYTLIVGRSSKRQERVIESLFSMQDKICVVTGVTAGWVRLWRKGF